MALRSPIAIVNERSLPPAADPLEVSQVREILGTFVDLARALYAIRSDLALATTAPLGQLPLTPTGLGFAAIAWIEGGIVKERWRYIQSRRNIAPFSSAPELTLPRFDEEFRLGNAVCVGLGIAASSGQLAVSFATASTWSPDLLELTRAELIEDNTSGEIMEATTVISVRHASEPSHAQTHARFVADLALPDPFSGADLWADRLHRYPCLQFLPRVENQLNGLGHGGAVVQQIHDRLCELNEAAAVWDPSVSPFPEWQSSVTPEGNQRKQLCMFEDEDGERRCFDLHARFTPGAGRIHFRLVPEVPSLRVAHIGRKLGA